MSKLDNHPKWTHLAFGRRSFLFNCEFWVQNSSPIFTMSVRLSMCVSAIMTFSFSKRFLLCKKIYFHSPIIFFLHSFLLQAPKIQNFRDIKLNSQLYLVQFCFSVWYSNWWKKYFAWRWVENSPDLTSRSVDQEKWTRANLGNCQCIFKLRPTNQPHILTLAKGDLKAKYQLCEEGKSQVAIEYRG